MRHRLFIAAIVIVISVLNTAYSQNKEFTVTNQSGYTITSMSISPQGANNWTPNLITTTKTVLNTETFDFKQTVDPANCVYDIKFTTSDGNDYYMKNVSLCKKNTLTLVVPMK